ncbi:MAG: hypothetical protein H6551_07675 [Chitinophagales bacterium]|nr:hypothetical protein [Chitinophagaceae bacterium]MCB9065009.1 hypothetical protein [Chitinophagales bacterium]
MKNLYLLLIGATLLIVSCNKAKPGYTTPVIDPTNTYDNRAVGASAKDLLRGDKYTTIELEIDYTPKHKLPQETVDAAVAFLEKYCHKSGGIHVTQKEIPLQGNQLTIDNLNSIESLYRTKYADNSENGKSIAIYVLVTDGTYSQNDVLGLAYLNSSVAIFDGKISDNTGLGKADRTTVATTVLNHEIGHLLGLVNSGTQMQTNHQDESHGKHCNNNQCLMYYTSQTTSVLGILLGGGDPSSLDANCEADLRANGGK